MTRSSQKTSAALLLGAPVLDAAGSPAGRLLELAVAPEKDAGHVSLLVLQPRRPDNKSVRVTVHANDVRHAVSGIMQLKAGAELTALSTENDFLMLERDVLDQQIIDVHGHKVVRVNDVVLAWEISDAEEDDCRVLRILEVETGLRGAARRLLKGLPSTTIEKIAMSLRSTTIPWEFVDLIDRDPSRRVRLKIEQDSISKMHPSDLADILEELAPTERRALFKSLDEEVAAEALEEVKPRMQQALIEELDSETIAGIVEEMDPGAAADLLSELPEERSDAILEEMDPEERREVEDLLGFDADSAAGQMTTDYLSLPRSATVQEVKDHLQKFGGDVELVSDIYLEDEQGRTYRVVPLVQLLMADLQSKLEDLPHGHFVCCDPDTPGRKVAELFDKYNLRSLPVIGRESRLVGVVHAEQVIASLRAKH